MPSRREPESPFEAAYTAPVADAVPPRRTRSSSPGELAPRATPAQPVALHGCVLTPSEAREKWYVVIGVDNTIQAVQKTKPQGTRVCETEGVILPGLIDLHGHPEFNVFAAWDPPRQFVN